MKISIQLISYKNAIHDTFIYFTDWKRISFKRISYSFVKRSWFSIHDEASRRKSTSLISMFEHSLNKTGLSRHSSSAKTGFTTGFWPPPFLPLFASRSILLAAPCSISRHWPRENSLFSPLFHCQMRRDCLTHNAAHSIARIKNIS